MIEKSRNKTNEEPLEDNSLAQYTTLEGVFTYSHIYHSYLKCLKGVSWKQSVQNYKTHALSNVTKLYNEIHSHAYKSKPYHNFTLSYRGKVRDCQSIHIYDRVLQKCLCDYCLLPLITPKLIYTNSACLKGRGVEFARANFKKSLQRTGRDGYVLLIDFKSYFANIKHDILLGKIAKLGLDNEILSLIQYLLKLYDENHTGKGLALGSQMSQSFALYYASEIDNYCYHYLHNKDYGRYMDDVYMFSKSKRKLQRALVNIRKIASRNGITLHPNKTKIVKVSNGVKYMKRRYLLTEENSVVELPNKDTFYRMKRKINKGIVSDNDFKSWYNGLTKTNCHRQLVEMKYYSEVVGEKSIHNN